MVKVLLVSGHEELAQALGAYVRVRMSAIRG